MLPTAQFYQNGILEKTSAFVELMAIHPLAESESIEEHFRLFDAAVKAAAPKNVSQTSIGGALNNAHGDWYEWLLAMSAWNVHTLKGTPYLAVLLPNIRSFDVAQLYEPEIYDLIVDLRTKVKERTSVSLISSNPDFVLIDVTKTDVKLPTDTKLSLTANSIRFLEELFTAFKGKCSFEALVGYASVKTSLRPDRRLQIPHEGSLMKAIYTHIQTRKWILNPPGLKYYAIAQHLKDADINALKTVATHSITTVQSLPQAAVDAAWQVDTLAEAEAVFLQLLQGR